MKKLFTIITFLCVVVIVSVGYSQPLGPGGIYGGGGGSGDVESVGDCTTGACLDGTSDGGRSFALYDGTANKITVGVVGALGGDKTLNLGATFTDAKWCSYATATGFTCNQTEPQAANATLTSIAGLTPTANAVIGWDGTPTLSALTSHSHSDSAAQFYSATASKGTLKFDQTGISDGKLVTVKFTSADDYTWTPTLLGNSAFSIGTTFTDAKWCTYATATGLTCNQAAPAGTGDILADGSVAFTGAPIPSAANTVALGSTSAEWADIYFGDGAIIYGQNDQSATLTSSASLWTANNFSVTTQFKLPSTDADPTATAGYIRHDSTNTSASGGGLIAWHDGTNIRQLVDTGTTFTQITKYEYLPIRYAEDDVSVAAPAAAAEIGTTSLIGRSFAEDADNGVIFFWQIPSDYVSGIKYRVYYALNANASADETAAFSLAGCSVGNSDALACSEGTAVVVTDELGTDDDTGELLVTGWSTAVTITNAAAGEMASLLLIRDVSEDDYSDHLLVSGIEIKYVSKLAPFSDY